MLAWKIREYNDSIHDGVGEGDPLGTVQEIWICLYEQVAYTQAGIRPGERDTQNSLRFWDTNWLPDLGQTTRPKNIERRIERRIEDFAVPADHTLKLKEGEKRDKYLDFARELKKQWNMKVTVILIIIGALSTIIKGKGAGRIGNKNTSGNHSNDSTVKIGQNTEKSPGDLGRVAVTQTPVKDHQLRLVWNTHKRVK